MSNALPSCMCIKTEPTYTGFKMPLWLHLVAQAQLHLPKAPTTDRLPWRRSVVGALGSQVEPNPMTCKIDTCCYIAWRSALLG